MTIKDFMLDNILALAVFTFSTTFAVSLISWLKTDSWIDLFKEIPSYIFYLFFLIMVLWFIGLLIYKRYNEIKSCDNSFYGTAIGYSYHGLKKIDEREYNGVTWEIQHPANLMFSPENIEIDTPPKCLTCKVELE